jgi:threonylcarbamoyladenosine tRNA methylthiotransferase CDKAL1
MHLKEKQKIKINLMKNKKIFYCSSIRKCELNSYLGSLVCNFFKKNGYKLVAESNKSDVIIIGTCAVDQTREDVALSLVNYYIERYLNKKQIIICGCLAKINPSLNKPKSILENLTLIGPKELDRFNEMFEHGISVEDIETNKIDEKFCNKKVFLNNSYSILICQGCINNCAYCAIKKAKGYVTSKPIDEIIKEFKRGLKLGFKHFIFLGDDCGSYGADIGTDFAELLNRVCGIKGDYKIDIHYLEPFRLEFLFPKINKPVFKKIYAIRLPLQSVNQRIVNLMNRKYNIKKVFEIIKEIKKNSPSIILRTHFIYCYPSETSREFARNVNYPGLEYFDEVKFFYFSPKKGTPAAKLKSKISKKERERRTEIIRQISKERKNHIFPYGDEIKVEGVNFGRIF